MKLPSRECYWTSLILVNIRSGNALVPSGNKSLPEPVFTKIHIAIWCHWATMSWHLCLFSNTKLLFPIWPLKYGMTLWHRVNTLGLEQNGHHSADDILTHWGRVTLICVHNLTIIGSDNGWSAPSHYLNQCWNMILLIGPLGTNFSEILIKNIIFLSRKCVRKCRLENGGHLVSASMC